MIRMHVEGGFSPVSMANRYLGLDENMTLTLATEPGQINWEPSSFALKIDGFYISTNQENVLGSLSNHGNVKWKIGMLFGISIN